MNISSYLCSNVNGPGKRFVLWTQGCSKGCSGCYNPETWSYKDNILISPIDIFNIIKNEDVSGVTISGGDPFEQEEELLELLILIDSLNLKDGVIVFSGFSYDEIRENNIRNKCCDYIDVLIDGRYDKERRISNSFKGSSNQNIIYFSSKIKPEELEIDQSVEVFIMDNIVEITGFPIIEKSYLKKMGLKVL